MKKYFILFLVCGFLGIVSFVTVQSTVYSSLFSRPPVEDTDTEPILLRSGGPEVSTADLPVSNKKHKIQVALLLDTSNSMDGLIEQAKSQLWKLVNELSLLKKEGEAPGLEIALFEYGNSGLSVMSGYVRQVAPLTTDLDFISENLFSLKTNGGEEYCGWVMKDALANLAWSDKESDMKLIVIAGNESFAQGDVDYRQSCKTAADKGVAVNTIFCGDYQEGIKLLWKDCGGGIYTNINHNDMVEHIPTPYDDQVIELNNRLNATYIQYGELGFAKKENQAKQDANATQYGAANARTRGFVKSKEQYKNAAWDLVDASEESEAALEVKTEYLPDEMKSMNKEERKAYVDKKRAEREVIKKELLDYEQKVNAYIAANRAASAEKKTLDNVMLESLRKQAKGKDFQ